MVLTVYLSCCLPCSLNSVKFKMFFTKDLLEKEISDFPTAQCLQCILLLDHLNDLKLFGKYQFLTTLRKWPFENNAGKGGNEHF